MSSNWIRVEDEMPPSGLRVIAFVPAAHGGKHHRLIRAMYAAKHALQLHYDADGGDYDEASDTYYCEPGWYEDFEYEKDLWDVVDPVTHWQYMPEPPEQESGK